MIEWATNYGKYHTLTHCMAGDRTWIVLVLSLCVMIAIGYFAIAWKWSHAERNLQDGLSKKALRDLRNIFLLCGACGYLWPWIEMVWPAWRLLCFPLAILATITIKYAISPVAIEVIYKDLSSHAELRAEMLRQHETILELREKMKERHFGQSNKE